MTPAVELTLLLNAVATLWMTGAIWFVQVVHYPLMAYVGEGEFARYEHHHTRRTGWAVGPPMLVEAATALLLALQPSGIPRWQAWTGLALVVVIWLSTALLQVPQHRRLEAGFDRLAHRRLVGTNWIRVVGWTLRTALVLSWLA